MGEAGYSTVEDFGWLAEALVAVSVDIVGYRPRRNFVEDRLDRGAALSPSRCRSLGQGKGRRVREAQMWPRRGRSGRRCYGGGPVQRRTSIG